MTRVKNAPGGSSGGDDDGRHRPSIPELLKGKSKGVQKTKTSVRKRTLSPGDRQALVVARAAERVERGGSRGSVVIRESDEHQSEGEEMDLEEQILEQQEGPALRWSSRVQAQSSQAVAASPTQPQRQSSRVPRAPKVKHYDLTTVSSKVIKSLRTVALQEWFPLQRQMGGLLPHSYSGGLP